ncbi:Membrane protein [hydrothermal vent metagenome]|uniref:Membrane protein n=1 Tax=hydrothermal vent metagenome TaxID=652676 RepID=A0A1W1DZZ9_9ZZZZ
MEFNQQDNQQNSIISVDKGEITLLHASLSTPCFISTNYYASAIDMTLEQLNKMTLFPLSSKDDIDILLVGTGANSRFLDPKQQVAIQQMGIGIESMSTESACRSFNLLLCDVRRVGLLLL